MTTLGAKTNQVIILFLISKLNDYFKNTLLPFFFQLNHSVLEVSWCDADLYKEELPPFTII